MTSSAMSRDSCVFYRPKTIFADITKKWLMTSINQFLWSRRLPRVSFNLIECLEPVKQDDHYFYAEILVCKFHLGSRKACLLACAEGSVTKFFYVKMFLRKFCSLGQSFMQNHQGGSRVI